MIRWLELEEEAEYHRGGSFRYITSSPPFFASRALRIDFGQHVRLGLVWSDVWSVVETKVRQESALASARITEV
jgi:hypothetical protein